MQNPKNPINSNLEILRGYASLFVVLSHIVVHNTYFNPAYFPGILRFFDPSGHVAVLLFFVLSGCVIGLSQQQPLVKSSIGLYLKKRFIRIYPLYFIAVLFGLLVSTNNYPLKTIISNFTITQNAYREVIWENSPLWSLNFEVLFYLLFIPLSLFRIKPAIALVFFFLVGVSSLYLPVNYLIRSYSFGYCFWLLGWSISANFEKAGIDYKVAPMIFFILSISALLADKGYISQLFSAIKILTVMKSTLQSGIIDVEDVIFLPYCFMVVLFFAGRDFRYKNLCFSILQLLPLYSIYIRCYKNPLNYSSYLPAIYYLLAIITYFINPIEELIQRFGLWLGSLSYGLYIIHFPILLVFGRMSISSNHYYFYGVKIIVYLSLTLFFSWILEKKMQPTFKKFLSSSFKLKEPGYR